MSVKGFKVGTAASEQYDYESLDNIPANLVQDANYVHTDNNYTNADKTKLSGIEAQATKTTIDATLTHSGQAADAKATGDAISALDAQALAAYASDTATGAIASFSDGADGIPMKSVLCAINPVQSGSGDPSPDNVRPISGFTALTLNRTGKNLFDKNAVAFKDGYARGDNGEEVTGSVSGYTQGITRVLPNTQYTLSGLSSVSGVSNVSFRVYYLTADGEWVSRSDAINAETMPYTFTTPATCGGVQIQCGKDTSFDTVQIEVGTSATAYAPYSGITTYPVSWQSTAGTVYGGTVDPVTGKLRVLYGMLDLGGFNWNYDTSSPNKRFFVQPSASYNIKRVKSYSSVANIICSLYKADTADNVTMVSGHYNRIALDANNPPYIIISDNIHTSAADFKQFVTGQKLVYELATPQTYQLTPTEVDSLLGANNLWHDANGNTTAVYRADTTLYIDKKIAALGG